MAIYLDNAATTPLEPRVMEVIEETMPRFGNPSSIHARGREVKALIENARKKVARLMDVAPGEIFFTSGGTEADNTALFCSVFDCGVKRIITSPIEHHAVLHAAQRLEALQLVDLHYVRLREDGHIDLEHLEELLHEADQEGAPTLVSLMHANNEIGNLLDLEKAGHLTDQYQALLHTDTVQTVGHLPLQFKDWKVAMAAASAHKFNGPKGIGFLYLDHEIQMKPFISGGAQERNMRGGTENILGIVGLARALEIAVEEMEEQAQHMGHLKQYMASQLREAIPGIEFNGDPMGQSLYTVLNVALPPSPVSEMLLFKLDIAGIAVSGGSACSSGSDVGSHVIKALPERPGYTPLRFSFGKYNTKEEIDETVAVLKEIMAEPAMR